MGMSEDQRELIAAEQGVDLSDEYSSDPADYQFTFGDLEKQGIEFEYIDPKAVCEFFMAMQVPTKTHQEKSITVRNGKPVVYEDAELKAVRAKLMAHLGQNTPKQKYTGALRLVTKWCFGITGKHCNGEYKITKPDTDNLVKLLKDCMTDCGYWTDDAIVASEIIEKFWAEIPGIYVRIEKLEEIK